MKFYFKLFRIVLVFIFLSLRLSSIAYTKNIALIARTGIQPNNISRFVLETYLSPSYTINYNSTDSINITLTNTDISNINTKDINKGVIKFIDIIKTDNILRLQTKTPVKIHKVFVLSPSDSIKNYRLVIDLVSISNKPTIQTRTISSSHKQNIYKNNKISKKVIVIDAGHGGKDPGTIGVGGTYEKNIALSMARQLRDVLLKNPNYNVILTRDNDTFIKLQDRAKIAERNHASLFISIHLNSSPNKKTNGFSIYTLSEKATDEEAKKIAEKENAADLLGIGAFEGYDTITKNILGDLLQTQVKIASVDIANAVVSQVKKELPCIYNPHREAPFVVLRSATPSVLMEIGFLSNKDEEKKLNQKWYREKMAYSIARAIDSVLIKD